MQSQFCPNCRTVANMIETVTRRAIAGHDGKMDMITIKTYHCESCRSFVSSKEEGPRFVPENSQNGKRSQHPTLLDW